MGGWTEADKVNSANVNHSIRRGSLMGSHSLYSSLHFFEEFQNTILG